MELKCEDVVSGLGCDYVAMGTSVEDVHAAMMAHGGATHADLMDGKSPAEMVQAKTEMDAHIHQLLAVRS